MAAALIKDFILDHNMYQWEAARKEGRRPDLLPALVGVEEVVKREELVVGDLFHTENSETSRHTHIEVRAKYRIYYSRRDPGSKRSHRFDLGRVREGRILFDVYSSEEGKDYRIEFPELRLKVET